MDKKHHQTTRIIQEIKGVKHLLRKQNIYIGLTSVLNSDSLNNLLL